MPMTHFLPLRNLHFYILLGKKDMSQPKLQYNKVSDGLLNKDPWAWEYGDMVPPEGETYLLMDSQLNAPEVPWRGTYAY